MQIPDLNILKNDRLHKQLSEAGYVVVPFLNKEETERLRDFFYQHHPVALSGFYATAHVSDVSFRKMMSEFIKNTIARATDHFFTDYSLLGGSFIAKAAGEEGTLQPHQDWNIVDETKYRSLNIWIPLVDVHQNNGTIVVMPGSHRWLSTYRHISIPCAFRRVYHLLWKYSTPLYLKAGDALIYDHALLHASAPNRTGSLRLACACGIIPKEAPMRLYCRGNGEINEYECSADYFLQENIFSAPSTLRKIRSLPYEFPEITEREFYLLSGIPQPFEDASVAQSNQSANNTPLRIPAWKVYTPANIFREIKHRLLR